MQPCDARTHTVCPGSSNDSGPRNAELTAAWTTAVLNRSVFLWFLFPLLVLNVQKHVVQRLGQRNPRQRLAASFLQSCNFGTDVYVAIFLPVLQFFAFCQPHFLNLSACFCPMLTIQNVKRAICNANHVPQQREAMSSIECETSHTAILPCRYAQRSRWRQCLASDDFSDNLVVVDLWDLSPPLGLVNSQISTLYLHCLSILLPQPLLNVNSEVHLGYPPFSPLLLASFLRRVPLFGPW